MTRRMTENPRLMPRKSALRVSDGPWTPSAPSLLLSSIAAKNATGMVSAKTLPGLLATFSSLPETYHDEEI
jgi:hypothetical protein